MRVKLAVLEGDKVYLSKIVSIFEERYSDNLQVFAFTDENLMFNEIQKNKIDVLLANEDFDIDTKKIPKRCGFAYLTDNNEKTEVRDVRAIAKFQKVDLIYREIISVYSEVAESFGGMRGDENSHTKIVLFTSPAGGTGTTTMSAAYTKKMAREKKVIYLSLNLFDKNEIFFNGDGTTDFGDIIFALKSQNVNLRLKVEGTVRKDISGAEFFMSTSTALDMMELNSEEIIRLLNILKADAKYDYIIIDSPFDISENNIWLFEVADKIVMVSDGSESANIKTVRAIKATEIIQDRKDINLLAKMAIIYNRFSSRTGKVLEGTDIENIGGVAKFENASSEQIVEQLTNMQMLENIM